MEMNYTVFGRSMDAAGVTPPDFRALVALLAAAQATHPTAKLAIRLAMGRDPHMGVAESLMAIFAPAAGDTGSSRAGWAPALAGCFNPSVPFSNTTVTEKKAW